MKTTLFERTLIVALLLFFTGCNAMRAAVAECLNSSDGWFEVTDLESISLSSYYFAFYDRHDVMLGLADGTSDKQGNDAKTVWFQSPANPLADNTKLWRIEAMTNIPGHENQFTLRNGSTGDCVLVTDKDAVYKYIMSSNTAANRMSGVIFTKDELTAGYWTIRNGYRSSASDNYLGPWNGGNFVAPQECAFNKGGGNDRPAQVKIYAILRSAVTEGSISNTPPITPAWIFGHFVWEDEKNTQQAVEGLVDDYLKHDIPVNGVIIDSPWTTAYNNFIWNTERYPAHDAMIDNFNDKGVKVMLWLTGCVNSISTGCAQDKCEEYDYVVEKNYGINNSIPTTWWKGTGIQIDFTNPMAKAWWYGQLDKVWREGIYGWKVDQGEVYFGDEVTTSIGTMTNEKFRPYYYNAMEDYVKLKTPTGANIGRPYSWQKGYHSDPAKMSMGWCGDFGGDWAGLKLQIDNIYRSAQAGYGAVGTEVAGFMGAKATTKAMFVRYAQFGATTACMINGGENGAFTNHLPWWHGDDVTAIYRDVVKLHNSLIPYLFSSVVDVHQNGGSLMKDVSLTDESHRLGNDFFTKAITSDASIVEVTLPTGDEWIDWFTGKTYVGGQTYSLNFDLARFPLYIRRGAIVPMDKEAGKTTLFFYPSETASSATLHLPQGDGIDYDDCEVSYNPTEGTLAISDDYSRSYVIEMHGIASIGGVEGATSYSFNNETGVLVIELEATTSTTLTLTGLTLAKLPLGKGLLDDASEDNPVDCSSLITDYTCTTKQAWSGAGRDMQKGEHWSGDANREYYDNNYSAGYRTTTVVLPRAGKYRLKASVRGPKDAAIGTFSFGNVSATFTGIGYEGGTIAADGTEWNSVVEGTEAGKTFANDGKGYGWFYGSLTVTTETNNQSLELRQVLSPDTKGHCGGLVLEYLGNESQYTHYLFVYFNGNSKEHVYYALSSDGYNYIPMNDGKAIVSADTISLKGGVRDPHVLRGEDGCFYMVLTDMRSADGWDSNRGIVMMRSRDLVNWSHSTVNFPTKYAGTNFANVTRVWAPETIWDPQANKYMVYFSLLTNDGTISHDKVYYCYANSDFTDLEGEPKLLYDRGAATIDMTIVYNEDDGLYHGFYKNEGPNTISKVTAPTLTAAAGTEEGAQWSTAVGPLQQTSEKVEGVGVFRLIDGETWVLMYDCYGSNKYQFCTSTDLNTFTFKQNTITTGTFTPHHGTVIPVTDAEVEILSSLLPTGIMSPVVKGGMEIDAGVYDLAGRRVAKPARGLYIVGGKKIIVK